MEAQEKILEKKNLRQKKDRSRYLQKDERIRKIKGLKRRLEKFKLKEILWKRWEKKRWWECKVVEVGKRNSLLEKKDEEEVGKESIDYSFENQQQVCRNQTKEKQQKKNVRLEDLFAGKRQR